MTKINAENCRALADFIESYDKASFDMSLIFSHVAEGRGDLPECGTAACILGFYRVAKQLDPDRFQGTDAADFLGITGVWEGNPVVGQSLSEKLFTPEFENAHWREDNPESPDYISRQMAVDTIRRLGETGRVEWVRP